MEEDYTTGKQYYEDILLDWPDSPEANWGLSIAACGLEDYPAARQHMQAVLQSSYVIDYDGTMGLIRCLPAIAMILAHEGEPEQAVELLALAFTPPASLTGWMERWPLLTRFRASLGAELGAEAFEAAWVRGETSDLKAVIAGVLRQFAESEELVDAVVPLVDQPLIEPLSERELEVLGLMAEGLSNREIAARLYLAVGTVKVHASNIYSKLDVSNRTQAVARARKLALL
jgi:DNA-binding CsgD family transcriptional regulator